MFKGWRYLRRICAILFVFSFTFNVFAQQTQGGSNTTPITPIMLYEMEKRITKEFQTVKDELKTEFAKVDKSVSVLN